jgi:hypothetical protein
MVLLSPARQPQAWECAQCSRVAIDAADKAIGTKTRQAILRLTCGNARQCGAIGTETPRHGVTALEALTATRLLAESMSASRGWITGEARREGASWTEVGHALGMTRQSAWEFFKKYAERPASGFEHLAVSELAALGEMPTDR